MQLVLVQPQLGYSPDDDNLATLHGAVAQAATRLEPDDIVLLPEHYDLRQARLEYEQGVRDLARRLGCHVVGGSHHERRNGGIVNSGIAVRPDGTTLCTYEKLRPYAEERLTVQPGERLGELTIAGRRILVLICADFWFSDLFDRVTQLPDVVLVPALSVTRKQEPDYSRALWQHLAVARAYEFGVYVGISDWGHPSRLPVLSASGVGGFADPTRLEPDAFFLPTGDRLAAIHRLDFERLEAFRADRLARGFFWRKP